MSSMARWREATAIVALVALSCSYWLGAGASIREQLADEQGQVRMTASDAAHYLRIAEAMRAGDWSLDHVRPTGGPDLAHRQPLYPAVLAVALSLYGHDLAALAMVNVALVVVAMWLAYAIGRLCFDSALAGVAAAAIVYSVPFLWQLATYRLLTEAGYVALVLALALAFLHYFGKPSTRALSGVAVLAGLAYLQRTNGLFLATGTFLVLLVADRGMKTKSYALALAVFVAVTAASWAPRLIHTGNPLYHGYLPNYLWVDRTQDALLPGPPRYGPQHYLATHDTGQVLDRLRYGLHRTLYTTPRDKFGRAASLAMLAGLVVVLMRRDRRVLAWVVVGIVQLLPLVWTSLPNPARRLPATALLPFGVVVVAAGAAALAHMGARTVQSWRSG